MSKARTSAGQRHRRIFAEDRAWYSNQSTDERPWSDPEYWKKQAQQVADIENLEFSRPHLRWDRHAQARYRRGIRSSVKTKWERYLRLKNKGM